MAVEGIDGTGKSTVLRILADYLKFRGIPSITSREPTHGSWGRKLRQSMTDGRLSLAEELELFLADRMEHVEQVIRPALAHGNVVLLDRYYLSTAAYQGARGADPESVLAQNEAFAPRPNLVLLLDCEPNTALERIRQRGDTPNTFEQLNQLREVRRIFLSLDRPFIRRVDASAQSKDVATRCCDILAQALFA